MPSPPSICLISELRGTFGVLTACGSGDQCWPPTLKAEEDSLFAGDHFSLITTRAFPIAESNWSIEDAVATQKPLYYDCSADVAGESSGCPYRYVA